MQEPVISLIIPVYNAAKYIHLPLESIKKQTYRNFEVIFINDGSTDNSAQLIQDFAKKNKNCIFINQKNQGVSAARNKGLQLAKGKYIMFLDNDDFLHPQCLEYALKLIKTSHADIVQFGVKDVYFGENVQAKPENNLSYKLKNNAPERFCDNKLRKTVLIWDKIYKAEIAKSVTFKNVQPGEDDLYSFETLLKAETMALSDTVLLFHSLNPQSVMHTIDTQNYKIMRFKVIDEFEKVIKQSLQNDITDNIRAKKLQRYFVEHFLFKEYLLKTLRKSESAQNIQQNMVLFLQKLHDFNADTKIMRMHYRLIFKLLTDGHFKIAKWLAI